MVLPAPPYFKKLSTSFFGTAVAPSAILGYFKRTFFAPVFSVVVVLFPPLSAIFFQAGDSRRPWPQNPAPGLAAGNFPQGKTPGAPRHHSKRIWKKISPAQAVPLLLRFYGRWFVVTLFSPRGRFRAAVSAANLSLATQAPLFSGRPVSGASDRILGMPANLKM